MFIDHAQLDKHTHPIALLWTSDKLVAEAATYTTHNQHKTRISIPSAAFEPAIPAIKRLQTHALDGTVTGDRRITCYLSRSALFWDFTQRWVVIPYRRFGTTYLFHLRLKDWTDGLPRSVGMELTTLRCVKHQNNAYPIFIVADIWNYA
jgi:hypothetical protein